MDLEIVKFQENLHGYLVEELTEILHAAYKPLAEKGMNYLATHQSPETTLRRLKNGVSFLGFVDRCLVSTITIVSESPKEQCDWYEKPGVYFFTQFAVNPDFQNKGFGSYLIDFAESYALENGASELSLDTSEHAHRLIEMYKGRGYRHIDYVNWSVTNYRSVILSKSMNSKKLHFRLADKSEGEMLTELALRSKNFWKYNKEYLEKCREALTVDEEYIELDTVVLAEEDSKVIGFFTLKNVGQENRLDHLWIEPEFIGKGYGKKLFKEAEYRASNLKWNSFRLAAEPMAEGFYIKMGMQKIGTIQSRIEPGLFLPHMEFILNQTNRIYLD